MNLGYKQWLLTIKQRIRSAQIKAALKVNAELLLLYWELGKEIVQRETEAQSGDNLINRLAKDWTSEFPDKKGLSRTNLYYVKKWYLFYRQNLKFVSQPVGELNQRAGKHSVIITNAIVPQVVGQFG